MKEIKFYIKTIGCKLNFTESSYISSYLVDNNCKCSEDKRNADLFILNTCSVTGHAEKKCIQEIRSFQNTNPLATVIVTGCFANLNSAEIAKEKNVKIIAGKDINQKKTDILNLISQNAVAAKTNVSVEKFMPIWSSSRTRCFLKIQDGCDNKCSYCTVHLARGSSKSASISDVCSAVENIAKTGVREIVLTGLNTADFGRLNGEQFFDLLQAIERQNVMSRFRISSIEPNLLTSEIISFIKESKCFMPHFHIPLQSGSDNVLKLMKRNYTTDYFGDTIMKIKQILPNAFIGIDIIAGMNGETAQDFEDSYNFISRLPLSFLHVFPYSERPNTAATGFSPIVPPAERHERVKKYLNLSNDFLINFYKGNIGKTFNVLFETLSKDNKVFHGFTDNYIKTEAFSDLNLRNQIVAVQLTDINVNTLRMKGTVLVDS